MMKSAAGTETANLLRRFPGSTPVWNHCEFLFDYNERDYDWLVVYDDLPPVKGERFGLWVESLACPRDHTLLITSEPSTVKTYGRQFIAQFGQILSSQEPWAVPHPRLIRSQPGLIWFYGRTGPHGAYDRLAEGTIPRKTKDLSTVCSSKKQKHTLHNRRYRFVQEVKKQISDMDVFGHGINPIHDKAEALDDYRYHLAIENHSCAHHWTEKLSDTFLGCALPFYFGCPNVFDYFPEDSLIQIDIFDPSASIERIKQAIRDKEYEKRLPAIQEARRLVLEEYSLFAEISKIVKAQAAEKRTGRPTGEKLMSRHAIRNKSPLNALKFGLEKCYVRTRNRLQKAK